MPRLLSCQDSCSRLLFIILAIIVPLGIKTDHFTAAAHKPEAIALDQRCTADALQRPVMDTTGGQLLAGMLPEKFPCRLVEANQTAEVNTRSVSLDVARTVIGTNEHATTGNNGITVGLATAACCPLDIQSRTGIPFTRLTIKITNLPFDRNSLTNRDVISQ